MRRIRFKLIHLLILMTIICIGIPSYFWFKEYQHRRQVERYSAVQGEMHDILDEFMSQAGSHPRGYATNPKRLKRNAELDQKSKLLEQEARELEAVLSEREIRIGVQRSR